MGLLLLLLELLLLPLLLASSTHVMFQSLLNHQAGEEFTYSCISIIALGLISVAFPVLIIFQTYARNCALFISELPDMYKG